MNKARNGFIKNLRYLCLTGVVALGFITIVATGGGGGGGGGGGEVDLGTGPKINNVQLFNEDDLYTPTLIFDIGDRVYFAVHAMDPDLDCETLYINQYYPQDSTTPYYGPDYFSLPSQPAPDTIFYNIEPITVAGPAGTGGLNFK